ncbi:MAG: hypothetical protein K6E20_00955 [Acholeplasmatales bacterium]|nr:hypothetical protein [Acholeplasmatales bacterium]
MKKMKLLMFGILSVLTLGIFAICTKVNAEINQDNYSLDLSAITVGSDKAVITEETFGATNNAFLTLETSNVTQRVKNSAVYCIEIKDKALSVTFNGTGTITVEFCSTGSSNESRFGVTDSTGAVLEASSAEATLITGTDDTGYYSVTGTSAQSVSYQITESGQYYLDSPSANVGRGCRIYSVEMTDLYGDIVYHTVNYYIDGSLNKTDSYVLDGNTIDYYPTLVNLGFDGWYTNSDCTAKLEDNYSVVSDIDLYGKSVTLSNYVDSSNMTAYSGGSTTYYNNTIFSFVDLGTDIVVEENTGMNLPDGTRSAYRINKANGSKSTDRIITFVAPYDGYVKVWAAAGSDSKNFFICETTYDVNSYIATEASPAKNTLFELTANVTAGNTYVIGGDSRFYIYGIFVESFADTVTFSGATVQGTSTADTTLGAVRFLGKLENVALADITSIKVSVQITGYSVHEFDVENVYTSITGFDNATAADDTLYFYFSVYNLDSTFNNDVFNFTAEITYSDSSVFTSETYSITYAA